MGRSLLPFAIILLLAYSACASMANGGSSHSNGMKPPGLTYIVGIWSNIAPFIVQPNDPGWANINPDVFNDSAPTNSGTKWVARSLDTYNKIFATTDTNLVILWAGCPADGNSGISLFEYPFNDKTNTTGNYIDLSQVILIYFEMKSTADGTNFYFTVGNYNNQMQSGNDYWFLISNVNISDWTPIYIPLAMDSISNCVSPLVLHFEDQSIEPGPFTDTDIIMIRNIQFIGTNLVPVSIAQISILSNLTNINHD